MKERIKYGRFEIRANIPSQKGMWPAFWLYGPCDYEIDVFEFDCEFPKNPVFTRHFSLFCDKNRKGMMPSKWKSDIDFSQNFHLFAVEWTYNQITWFVDDRVVRKDIANNDVVTQRTFPDSSLHVIVNLAAGGDFVNTQPILNTSDTAFFLVDFIKIYRLK